MSMSHHLRMHVPRVVALALVAVLCGMVALPTSAYADVLSAVGGQVLDSVEIPGGCCVPEASADDADGEELLRGYVEQRFAEELPASEEPERFQSQAGEALSGVDAIAYRELKAMIEEVAAGERTSTRFSIPVATLTGGKTSWTASELGVSSVMSGNRISQAARNAAHKLLSPNLSTVLDCLLVDCPYELYWFDKTVGISFTGISYETDGYHLIVSTKAITFSFTVSDDYAASIYEVDPSTGARVSAAIATAKDIVARTEGMDSYDRLVAYRDAICDLVSYNDEAMEYDDYPYGDPWQLVFVFDEDDETNVVCEGYAKAFQYLCDLSGFDDVESRIVSGPMAGGTGAGDHMWNVVTMPDGKNYLVDVTNSDTDTAGEAGGLFIAPYSRGSLNGGYAFETPDDTVTFEYDGETRSIWSDEQLTLSATPYGTDIVIDAVVVYRLYNHKTSEHLWTTSVNEYEQLPVITKGDWRQEGAAWYAPDDMGTPVYRLYNRAMGDHYYSMSQGEINALTTKYGWNLDNNGAPAFWSAAKDDPGAIPLYCVYNSKLKKGQHHFTRSVAERDFLTTKAGWRYEKEAFYGYLPE